MGQSKDGKRRQMNVELSVEVIAKAKAAAIQAGSTLAELVEEAIRAHLVSGAKRPGNAPDPIPVAYVQDIPRAVEFLLALGFEPRFASADGSWVELGGRRAILALHAGAGEPYPPQIEVRLDYPSPLEAAVETAKAHGFETGPIRDQAFGRSLQVQMGGVHFHIDEWSADFGRP